MHEYRTNWKYLSRFSHLYFRINLILMGMLTLERGSAECREGENWRWCCKLDFRAAAWKIQHYTMQELMDNFLQLLVTSGSKIGSFLSLDCNVHNWLKLFVMDWIINASVVSSSRSFQLLFCPGFRKHFCRIPCSSTFSARTGTEK